MAKLVSGRVKVTPPTQVTADRKEFLSLDQAEPNLGVPDVSGKVLASDVNGIRSWITPTSLTVTSPITNSGNSALGQYYLGFDFTTNNTWTGTQTFNGNVTLGSQANLVVGGNLTVNGTQTIINTTNLAINDSIIYLSQNQYATDSVDIGFYGAYGTTGGTISNHKHTGLVRSYSNGVWNLFSNGVEEPGQTVNLSTVTYDTLKLGSVVINGGTSSQFLKADGTLDSVSYTPSATFNSLLSTANNWTNLQTFNPVNVNSSAVNIVGKKLTAALIYLRYYGDNKIEVTATNHGFSVGQDVNLENMPTAPTFIRSAPIIRVVNSDVFEIAYPMLDTGQRSAEGGTATVYQNSAIIKGNDADGNSRVTATPQGQVKIAASRVLGNTFSVTDSDNSSPVYPVTNLVGSTTGSGSWTLTVPGHKVETGQWINFSSPAPSNIFGEYEVAFADATTNTIIIQGVDGTVTYTPGTVVYALGLSFYVKASSGSFGFVRNRGSLTPLRVITADNSPRSTLDLTESVNSATYKSSALKWSSLGLSKEKGGASATYGYYLGEYSSTSTPTSYWRASDGLTINGQNVISNSGVVAGVILPSNTNTQVNLATTVALSTTPVPGGGTASTVSGTSGATQLTVTNISFYIVAGQLVAGTGISSGTYVTGISGSNPYIVTLSSTLTATASGSYTFLGADGGTGVGNEIRFNYTTIDGTAVVLNDRVLVKNQTNAAENGVYYATAVSTSGAIRLTRTADSDNSVLGELAAGKRVFVSSGTVNAGTIWTLNSYGTATNGTIKIGTDSIVFGTGGSTSGSQSFNGGSA